MAKSAEEQKKYDLIKAFNDNIEMREAVKEVLLAGIYSNGVMKAGEKHDSMLNWAMSVVFTGDEGASNADIGAKVVAIAEGLRYLEAAFKKIETDYNGGTVSPLNAPNKAR